MKSIGVIALVLSVPGIVSAQEFSFRPAGELVGSSGTGRRDSNVYAPDIRFPMESGPAFANSQVYGHGGYLGSGGGQCDAFNYGYPWRDNYCETRDWAMPMCPSGHGHQGQDVRPATCENGKHWAVAVFDGTITHIGSYSVYLTDAMGRRFDYLHMSNVQVSVGQSVHCGDRLGRVSNRFGGTSTTIHLHFNTRMAVTGYTGQVYAPPYTSLVSAYQRLNGLGCVDPPEICPDGDAEAGRTCTAADDREACIGSVAVASEGCTPEADGTLRGRTCSCVDDGSGGARWECPDASTCRLLSECDACGETIGGGTPTQTPAGGTGGSGTGGSGTGGSGAGGGAGSGGSGGDGSGAGGSGSGGGFGTRGGACRAAPGSTGGPLAALVIACTALGCVRRRRRR